MSGFTVAGILARAASIRAWAALTVASCFYFARVPGGILASSLGSRSAKSGSSIFCRDRSSDPRHRSPCSAGSLRPLLLRCLGRRQSGQKVWEVAQRVRVPGSVRLPGPNRASLIPLLFTPAPPTSGAHCA